LIRRCGYVLDTEAQTSHELAQARTGFNGKPGAAANIASAQICARESKPV
jgi:hypothetical protein